MTGSSFQRLRPPHLATTYATNILPRCGGGPPNAKRSWFLRVTQIGFRPTSGGRQTGEPPSLIPGTGRAARDGSRKPWPAAPLRFTFDGVTDLRFDADDRHGMTVTCGDDDLVVSIGHEGFLRATSAWIRPDDPRWHESAAGRAADAVTPYARPRRQQPVRTSSLTVQERAAARALVDLMLHIPSSTTTPSRPPAYQYARSAASRPTPAAPS
jgi:hypothetical protein